MLSSFQVRARAQLGACPQGLPPWEEWEPPKCFVSQVPLHAPSQSVPDLRLRLVEAAR